MTPHKPLKWIEDKLIFPPASPLAGAKLKGHLLSYQKDLIRAALNADGSVNKSVFIGFSRKIAKSFLFSAILTYLLTRRGVASGVLASSGDQAAIVFGQVGQNIGISPYIDDKIYKIHKDKITNTETYSTCERFYNSPGALLGRSLSVLCCDEIGAMPSQDSMDSLSSGMAFAKDKPLLLCASNPPQDPGSHWSLDFVREKKKDRDWKVFHYAADSKVDPFSKAALAQANPLFKAFQKHPKKYPHLAGVARYLLKQMSDAKKSGNSALIYMKYQLGRLVVTKNSLFIDGSTLRVAELGEVLKLPNLSISLGLDLAFHRDFCACCVGFHTKDSMFLYPILHIPNGALKDRTPRQVSYFRKMHNEGFITIQDQKVLCKDEFLGEIKDFLKKNQIAQKVRSVVWDRGLCPQEWQDSLRYGQTFLVRASPSEFAAPIESLQALSKAGRLYLIGESPITRKMFSDCITSERSRGFRMLNRASSAQNIDIAIATCLSKWHALKFPYQEAQIFSV